VKILEGNDWEMQDGIWERGVRAIEKKSGIDAITRIVLVGNLKAQEKAVWILERVFRVERNREKYGKAMQVCSLI
jgi:vacuolar protein 8